MNICKAKNYQDMSRKAANIISAQVIMKPHCVLGLATGSSPIGTYKQLIEWYNKGDLDFARVMSINLDEYKGLSPENPQSYRYFMNTNLFDHINIDKTRTFVPNGLEPDPEKACAAYEEIIRQSGGIDLQLLGLGRNGHIGFNEPADSFARETHCVNLTESTIQANRRFFDSEASVPRQAVSLGVGSILASRCILLLATGEDKAQAIHDTVCGDITSRTPASILKTHPNVILLLDRAAAGML